MIEVTVRLHGAGSWEGIAEHSIGSWAIGLKEVMLPDGADVTRLLAHIGVDRGLANIVVVNGQVSGESTVLNQGDRIELIPPITGGRLLLTEEK